MTSFMHSSSPHSQLVSKPDVRCFSRTVGGSSRIGC